MVLLAPKHTERQAPPVPQLYDATQSSKEDTLVSLSKMQTSL